MAHQLDRINEWIKSDPAEFTAICDAEYNKRVAYTADQICENIGKSPIVLLAGPSGSGKTTTAKKLEEELRARGIGTHVISMDNYFLTVDPATAPKTPAGEIDYESPECMNMGLLNAHFAALSRGEEIVVPHYAFKEQKQSDKKAKPLQLGRDEVVIFEGIHALNDSITDKNPDAFELYVSARSDVEHRGRTCFSRTWVRLVRRIVRDHNFRGTPAETTIGMWSNVRRGEKLYISPYKYKADFILDSSLPYEVPVMKAFALPLLAEIPEGLSHFEPYRKIMPAFELFRGLDEKYVAPESMLREFIGGGIYKY